MKGFLMVPDEVALDDSIPDSTLRIFLVLSRISREKKTPELGSLGIRTIARLAKRSRNTADKAMEALRDRGYVEKIRREGATQLDAFEYRLTSKWFIPKAVRQQTTEQEVFNDGRIKVTKKVRGKPYKPTQYTLKENAG